MFSKLWKLRKKIPHFSVTEAISSIPSYIYPHSHMSDSGMPQGAHVTSLSLGHLKDPEIKKNSVHLYHETLH